MDMKTIREIQFSTRSNERMLFPYFKNRHALLLLAWFVGGEGCSISEIKRSRYAGLLQKPLLKNLAKRYGDGRLTADRLLGYWPHFTELETYRITLGEWGTTGKWRWHQISRPGGNLVIQLNFTNTHNHEYKRILRINPKQSPFSFSGHPVSEKHNTLAWARIDLDFDTGEALIEEIQNDWIRDVISELKWVEQIKSEDRKDYFKWCDWRIEYISYYFNQVLKPHVGLWSEAMLSAAIWFLRKELGISKIYYHTFEWGNRLKGMTSDWAQPPRSIYTKLPKSFGFELTDEVPKFLLTKTKHRPTRRLLRNEPVRFYTLEV